VCGIDAFESQSNFCLLPALATNIVDPQGQREGGRTNYFHMGMALSLLCDVHEYDMGTNFREL
jgi:hypothetical protein